MNIYIILIFLILFLIIIKYKNIFLVNLETFKSIDIEFEGIPIVAMDTFKFYDKDFNIIQFNKNDKQNYNYIIYYLDQYDNYPNLIYPITIKYTKNLKVKFENNNMLINNERYIVEKKKGDYFIVKYNIGKNITYIEYYIQLDNIIKMLNQIEKLVNITNNKIIFLDFFVNNKKQKIIARDITNNFNNCDSYLFTVLNLMIIIQMNKNIFQTKKLLLFIIGNLLNKIKKNKVKINTKYIKDDSVNVNHNQNYKNNKEYKLDKYIITNESVEQINYLIENLKTLKNTDSSKLNKYVIGEGLFSIVYINGTKILKVIKSQFTKNPIIFNEIDVAKKIKKLNNSEIYFPKFYDVYLCNIDGKIRICMEFEYIHGYTINNFFNLHKNKTTESLNIILNNIIKNNKYFNDNGIARWDNNGNNIIIKEDFSIKYIDHGLTKIIDNTENKQLDKKDYFILLTKFAIYIIQTNVDYREILSKLFEEFVRMLNRI